MTATPSGNARWKPVIAPPHHDILVALMQGLSLDAVVPAALDLVDRDPLISVGHFRGDVLRGLMEVPGSFWGHHAGLFDRYRAALRAGAIQRRALPPDERLDFWKPIEIAGRENTSPLLDDACEPEP
jgi:hypothetical protein